MFSIYTSSMTKKPRTLDIVWEHILKYIGYDFRKRIQPITAKQIKEARQSWKGRSCQFEPRLLCKQDTRESRPEVFKTYGICILSVKNGEYVLTKRDIYVTLEKWPMPALKITQKHDSCILSISASETGILDRLRYNGVLEDIIGESIKYGPLLGGRRRCHFETRLGSRKVSVKGSQCEIDGCYETENYICIIEVKAREVQSFNIRQLYYPYRAVYDKIGKKKEIICLFIYKDKHFIHIFKYKWNNPNKILDITLISYHKYC
jgi:hypothetical protein